MANTDLDLLLPEDDTVTFTAKNGQKYTILLSVPFAVGSYIIDNADLLVNIFPRQGERPKFSKEIVDAVLKIFAVMCHEQYEEMTEEWIRKNISFPRLVLIMIKVATPILTFMSTSGLLETVQPEKEPERN